MTEGSRTLSVRLKQHAVIEYLPAENVPPINVHRRMQVVHGDNCIDASTVRHWVRHTKGSDTGEK